MEITARYHHTLGYDEQLWLYRNGTMFMGVTIDRTRSAKEWAERFGMKKCESITADTGEKFDIYRNDERGLANAIPA